LNNEIRGVLLGVSVAFIVIFAGLTLAALASAELNFASIIAFGFSFLIIGLALVGLIGAIRNPPDEDD
jgi:hypothetical protein